MRNERSCWNVLCASFNLKIYIHPSNGNSLLFLHDSKERKKSCEESGAISTISSTLIRSNYIFLTLIIIITIGQNGIETRTRSRMEQVRNQRGPLRTILFELVG